MARPSDVNTTVSSNDEHTHLLNWSNLVIGWYPLMQRGSSANCWSASFFQLTAALVLAVCRWSCLKILSNLRWFCGICNVTQSNEKKTVVFVNPWPVFGRQRRRLVPRVWVCNGLFVPGPRRSAPRDWVQVQTRELRGP